MHESHPQRVSDPVCGMAVDVARAEAAGLTLEHRGRTYAFCRAGCRRAFEEDPDAYTARAEVAATADREAIGSASASGLSGLTPAGSDAPAIDEGMRRWYESCPCCLSDAYPEVKAALDAERAAAAQPAAGPGICEVAEAAEGVVP